jgi:hypothetical protein
MPDRDVPQHLNCRRRRCLPAFTFCPAIFVSQSLEESTLAGSSSASRRRGVQAGATGGITRPTPHPDRSARFIGAVIIRLGREDDRVVRQSSAKIRASTDDERGGRDPLPAGLDDRTGLMAGPAAVT